MAEDYWKKPDPVHHKATEPIAGIWSRSRAFRILVWATVLLAVSQLALFASAYLSGFSSVFEMMTWIKTNFTG